MWLTSVTDRRTDGQTDRTAFNNRAVKRCALKCPGLIPQTHTGGFAPSVRHRQRILPPPPPPHNIDASCGTAFTGPETAMDDFHRICAFSRAYNPVCQSLMQSVSVFLLRGCGSNFLTFGIAVIARCCRPVM